MVENLISDYFALYEVDYRRDVFFPEVSRRAQLGPAPRDARPAAVRRFWFPRLRARLGGGTPTALAGQ
jgi:hypothetical protein